jgi:hypothetical protein
MTGALLIAAALCASSLPTSPPPVLWREPRPMTVADWTWGSGGESGAPRPPFRFERENLGGTNPKVDVRDTTGRLWMVKFGGEVKAETFASRLLYATGYFTQSTYFVSKGIITGAHHLKRARPFIEEDGTFHNARFRLRDDRLIYLKSDHWSWNDNPFLGTPELGGLKILLMLASNWDTKDSTDRDAANTAIFRDTLTGELIYSFDDWGDSFGKSGGFMRRTRWDAPGYEQDTPKFVSLWTGGYLAWGFDGKHASAVRHGTTLEDVRWLMPYLDRITPEQLRAGIAASGGTPAECDRFAAVILMRIEQLREVAASQNVTH